MIAKTVSLAWLVACTTVATLFDIFDIIRENIRTSKEAWTQQDVIHTSYGKKGK